MESGKQAPTIMFKEAKSLKNISAAIKNLTQAVNCSIYDGKMFLQGMNSHSTALVQVALEDAVVGTDGLQSTSFVCSSDGLVKILSEIDIETKIVIQTGSDSEILFTFEDKETFEKSSQKLPLTESNQDTLGIPEMEYKCICTFDSLEFANICSEIEKKTDTIYIEGTNKRVRFLKDEEVLNTLESLDTAKDSKGEAETYVKQCYDSKTLELLSRAHPVSSKVQIRIAEDVPLAIEYKLEDKTQGTLTFYLAPKITAHGP